MGEIIVPNAVQRKPNKIYYINGNGDLCEAEMQHKGKSKKIKKSKKK